MTVQRDLKIIPGTTFRKKVAWLQPVLGADGRQSRDANGQPLWAATDTTGYTPEFTVGLAYEQPPPFALDLVPADGIYGSVTLDNAGNFVVTIKSAGTLRVKSNMVFKLKVTNPGGEQTDLYMGKVVTS